MRSVLPWAPGGAHAAVVAAVNSGVTATPAAAVAAAIALCLCMLSCARPRLTPTPADTAWAAVQWPGTTDEDLSSGYATYRRRCAGCHHLPLPDAHLPEKWNRTLPEMARKAKLTSEEEDRVLRYVLAVRTRDEAPAASAAPSEAARPAPERPRDPRP